MARACRPKSLPPAADAAILAAARRAVDAGPRRVAEATRPERWWAPLAAAATIGAIAIGILQLAAPDKTAAPPGIVSDMPVAPAPTPKVDALAAPDRQRTARPDAGVDAPAPAKDIRKPMAVEPRAATERECIPGAGAAVPHAAGIRTASIRTASIRVAGRNDGRIGTDDIKRTRLGTTRHRRIGARGHRRRDAVTGGATVPRGRCGTP